MTEGNLALSEGVLVLEKASTQRAFGAEIASMYSGASLPYVRSLLLGDMISLPKIAQELRGRGAQIRNTRKLSTLPGSRAAERGGQTT